MKNSPPLPAPVIERRSTAMWIFYIVIVLLPLASVSMLKAATTLGVGDISFISAEADTIGSAADGYSIVTWVDLTAGTVIKFTDNGLANAAATSINNTEHAWTFTVGASTITAGTTLNFGYASPTTGKWNGPASGTVSADLSNDSGGTPNSGLSTSGDQLFVYQGTGTVPNIASGTAPTAFSGTLVSGINFGTVITTGNPDSNSTYAPTSLVSGNAWVNGGNLDNGYYVGARTGLTNALFRAATTNLTNFSFSNTENVGFDRTTSFTVGSSASIYWDANGSTAGDGGTSTWDTTTNDRFKNGAAGTTYFRWVNSSTGNDHTAVFGGTAGTVTVSGGVTASGLQFATTGYTLTGSTITLSGSTTPVIDTGTLAATINSALAGTQGFTKTGSGPLTLGGNNTGLSGTISLNAGNIVLTHASGLGTGTLSIGLGSNLDAGTGFTSGTSGNRNTTAALNTIALTGAVTIANNIVLPADTVLNTRSIYVKGGTGNSTRFTGTISGGSSNLTLFLNNDVGDINGVLRLSGTNTFTTSSATGANSGINLNRGSLQIDSNAALGADANSLFLDSFTGQQLIFTTGFTYTHPTTLEAGVQTIFQNNTAGTQLDLTAAIGGGSSTSSLRLTSNTSGDTTTTYRLAGTNTLAGKIELYRGAVIITNNSSLGTATLQLNGNNNTTLGDVRFENSVTLANNIELVNTSNPDPINTNGNTATLNGIISSTGTQGLVKIGAGTLVLGGANTYTVTTTVSNGTLRIASVAANGTAQPLGQASSAITLGGAATTGTLEYTGGSATLARPFTISSSTGSAGIIKNSGSGTLTLSGTLTKDGRVLTLTGGAFTVSGKITGASASSDLVVDNAAVTLTNATNDYNGPTIIQNSGKILMAGDYLGQVPGSATAGNLVLNSGTLNTTANVALSSNRGIALGPQSGSGSGTIETDSGTTLTLGSILANNGSGTGSLIKTGTGTVILTGASIFSGGTTVSAGTMEVNNTTGSGLGSGDVHVQSGAKLQGTGIIGALAVIENGGVVEAGTSSTTGTLRFTAVTMNDGSRADFHLTANGVNDVLDITGSNGFTVGTGSSSTASFKVYLDYAAQLGDAFNLLDWVGVIGGDTDLSNNVDFSAAALGSGLSWDTSSFHSSGVISVIPEPSRALLLALGSTGLLLRRRRQVHR